MLTSTQTFVEPHLVPNNVATAHVVRRSRGTSDLKQPQFHFHQRKERMQFNLLNRKTRLQIQPLCPLNLATIPPLYQQVAQHVAFEKCWGTKRGVGRGGEVWEWIRGWTSYLSDNSQIIRQFRVCLFMLMMMTVMVMFMVTMISSWFCLVAGQSTCSNKNHPVLYSHTKRKIATKWIKEMHRNIRLWIMHMEITRSVQRDRRCRNSHICCKVWHSGGGGTL